MPKNNIPNYRLHKATGQAFVELGGRRFYLGKHGSKASKEEYERKVAEYLANGRKLAPTQVKTGITCRELSVHFLEWAEEYYQKNGEQTKTFPHCRQAVSLLVKHFGNESVNNFTPLALVSLQKQWIEKGHARLTVNRYVNVIKQMFRYGAKFQWVEANVNYALLAVDSLKAGRTKAWERENVEPVDNETVDRTLPFMPPIIRDMVRVQRLCGMRPQDVRNMRPCDIDTSKDVWVYRPFTHKTEHHGKKLAKAIGPRAQAILTPYMIDKHDSPESFLFSPGDSENARKLEMREKRKTPVQPSQQKRNADRRKSPKRMYQEQYSGDGYNRAILRACIKAGATTTITGLSENTEYEFQVRASRNEGNSNWSESVFVVTDRISTSSKRRRAFGSTGKTTDSVTLAWAPVSNATGYEVQYRQSGTTTWTNVSIPMFPHWTPNQLRHSAGTETTANFSLEAAKEFLGHSSITTTEKFYVAPLPELAAEVARKFG